VALRYDVLRQELTAVGLPPDTIGPVIADFPIWYAEGVGQEALALPDEAPSSVLDLARRFGATVLVISKTDHGRWPAVIDQGRPDAACFPEVALPVPTNQTDADALGDTRVFRIGCR
jgi:hypothetical protein